MINRKSTLALSRCESDEKVPGWYSNPVIKEHIQLALDWMRTRGDMNGIDLQISSAEK